MNLFRCEDGWIDLDTGLVYHKFKDAVPAHMRIMSLHSDHEDNYVDLTGKYAEKLEMLLCCKEVT